MLAGLEDVAVEIPFPSALSRVLADEKIRVRGDVGELYADVQLYHFLAQRTQPYLRLKSGGNLIPTSPNGAIRAIELFRAAFEAMLSGLDSMSKEIIKAMKDLDYRAGKTISMKERRDSRQGQEETKNNLSLHGAPLW